MDKGNLEIEVLNALNPQERKYLKILNIVINLFLSFIYLLMFVFILGLINGLHLRTLLLITLLMLMFAGIAGLGESLSKVILAKSLVKHSSLGGING